MDLPKTGIILLNFRLINFSNKTFNRSTDYLLGAVSLAIVVPSLTAQCQWARGSAG
jgi:hypothetical protein